MFENCSKIVRFCFIVKIICPKIVRFCFIVKIISPKIVQFCFIVKIICPKIVRFCFIVTIICPNIVRSCFIVTMGPKVSSPSPVVTAEAYYYVMMNSPMTLLTLNRLQKSDGRTWNKHSIGNESSCIFVKLKAFRCEREQKTTVKICQTGRKKLRMFIELTRA